MQICLDLSRCYVGKYFTTVVESSYRNVWLRGMVARDLNDLSHNFGRPVLVKCSIVLKILVSIALNALIKCQ